MTDDAMHNDLARLPERLAEHFGDALRRVHVVADVPQKPPVPAWCRSPVLRGFVVAHALAAPLLILLYALTR